jgi:hypothetical protein
MSCVVNREPRELDPRGLRWGLEGDGVGGMSWSSKEKVSTATLRCGSIYSFGTGSYWDRHMGFENIEIFPYQLTESPFSWSLSHCLSSLPTSVSDALPWGPGTPTYIHTHTHTIQEVAGKAWSGRSHGGCHSKILSGQCSCILVLKDSVLPMEGV